MARRVQIFTRLTTDQIEALEVIGAENDLLIERNGEVNQSETIRYLLAKADQRLIDMSNHPAGKGRA